MNKPKGYEDYLSDYGICFYDGLCGEPIGWGFKIIRPLGEEKFRDLAQFGKLECSYPSWFLITKVLELEEAVKLYGPIEKIITGPRGGYKYIIIGDKHISSELFREKVEQSKLYDSIIQEVLNQRSQARALDKLY